MKLNPPSATLRELIAAFEDIGPELQRRRESTGRAGAKWLMAEDSEEKAQRLAELRLAEASEQEVVELRNAAFRKVMYQRWEENPQVPDEIWRELWEPGEDPPTRPR